MAVPAVVTEMSIPDAPEFEIELYTLDANGQPDDTALHAGIIADISEADERHAKQSSRAVMLRHGWDGVQRWKCYGA